jgi:hypothetical protein
VTWTPLGWNWGFDQFCSPSLSSLKYSSNRHLVLGYVRRVVVLLHPLHQPSVAAADCFEGDDHAPQDGDAHADAKPLVARPDLR